MILQALTSYYETLVRQDRAAGPGWVPVKVTYGLSLDADGALLQVVTLAAPNPKGKKPVARPMSLPMPVKRSSRIAANFLCDNATYLLGLDGKGNAARAKQCFAAARTVHLQLLDGVDTPAAHAVRGFFTSWQPAEAETAPVLDAYREALRGGANLVFLLGMDFVHEDAAIRAAWQRHYDHPREDAVMMQCLVTGRLAPVAVLHPAIRGVRGGLPTGNSLVSFNARAYESYGREGGQGLNAPVSEYAAFAYGAALNSLLADRQHQVYLGDTTVVFWAEDAQPAYQDAFRFFLNGPDANSNTVSDQDLLHTFTAMQQGRAIDWDGIPLHPDNPFYILGLAPNAARLSVRFFLQNSFSYFMENLRAHYARLEIVRPSFDQRPQLTAWNLLRETVNQKSRDKSPSPQMAGDFLHAILTNGRYPATLYQNTLLRIRAEREVTRGRAAIIKAYLLHNTTNQTTNGQEIKEAANNVKLNEETRYQPYVLGRLFSVLENLQLKVNPKINTTIRDKYFTSACATPAVVFPTLLNLADKHRRKLSTGNRIYFAKQIGDLTSLITESYPAHHTLRDQGIFQLGYYHQTQKRYDKKTTEESTKEEPNHG